MKRRIISFFCIICLLFCMIPNFSNAETFERLTINRAPRYSVENVYKDKVIINLNDGNGISSVKLEKYDGDTKKIILDTEKDKQSTGVTISDDKTKITLKTNLIGKKSTKFKLTVCDSTKYENYLQSTFKLRRVKDKDGLTKFAINNSPRLSYSLSNIQVEATDNNDINKLIIKDLNNNKAIVETTGTNNNKTIDFSKAKINNNRYNLLVIVTDKTGMTRTEKITLTAKYPKEIIKTLDGKDVTLYEGDKVYFLDTQYKTSKGKIRGSDCFIIESNGKYAMIDTATKPQSGRVLTYLEELNIKELEFVLITHFHWDHIGGYKDISENVTIKNLYIKNRNEKIVEDTVELAKSKNTNVIYVEEMNTDKTIKMENFEFKLFNTKDLIKDQSDIDENINSITALATVNDRTIYFASDIENNEKINAEDKTAKEVKEYLKSIKKEKVDIYKVSHHAFDWNNTKDALKYLNPVTAIVTNIEDRKNTRESIKRISEYVENNGGEMCYTEAGTVVLNISKYGTISLKQLDNYYE